MRLISSVLIWFLGAFLPSPLFSEWLVGQGWWVEVNLSGVVWWWYEGVHGAAGRYVCLLNISLKLRFIMKRLVLNSARPECMPIGGEDCFRLGEGCLGGLRDRNSFADLSQDVSEVWVAYTKPFYRDMTHHGHQQWDRCDWIVSTLIYRIFLSRHALRRPVIDIHNEFIHCFTFWMIILFGIGTKHAGDE
jgi:hypothetical protein